MHRVTIRRVIVMTTTVDVDAEDEDEASDAAIEMAQSGDASWLAETSDDSDYEVTEVEEVDPGE